MYLRKVLMSAAMSLVASMSFAEPYPAKPVTMVTPMAPGGAADIAARTLASELQKRTKQPFIVVNKPGAGALLASDIVAASPPDGYTLLLNAASAFVFSAINPSIARHDPRTSFTPIGGVVAVPHILVVNSKLPVANVKELVAYLKENPGKVSYASIGVGSTTHLEAELFQSMTGTKMVHVPYKGSAPALTDLLEGRVQVMFDSYSSSKPHLEAGRLRVLGISTAERATSTPDIPTISESGVPGYDASGWLGIVGPAGLPEPVLKKLSDALADIQKDESVKNQLRQLGLELLELTPSDFAAYINKSDATWKAAIKAANIETEGNKPSR